MVDINFNAKPHDFKIINKIANRAGAMFKDIDSPVSKKTLLMDITATHLNGCPLRLEALLDADNFNFAHDLFGIREHLNRETGQLDGHFRPRFATPAESGGHDETAHA